MSFSRNFLKILNELENLWTGSGGAPFLLFPNPGGTRSLGFLFLNGLVFLIGYQMINKLKGDPANGSRPLIAVLLVSLLSWFFLGFFHNVSYVRSLGVLLWVLLGWSASLVYPQAFSGKEKLNTWWFPVGLLILTAAFGYQLKLIHDRPLPPFFQTGLYDQEILPGGEKIRWTGKRAVLNTNIQKQKVILFIAAPLPEVIEHPQKVRLGVGQKDLEVILRDTGWHKVTIPLEGLSSGRVLVKIVVAYTFNLKKAKMSEDDRDLGIMIRDDIKKD